MMKNLPVLVRDAVGFAGCGLIVWGCFQIHAAAGTIIAGLMLAGVATVSAVRK